MADLLKCSERSATSEREDPDWAILKESVQSRDEACLASFPSTQNGDDVSATMAENF
jgi:hypothetical protein